MNSYYDQKGSSSVPEQHDVTMKRPEASRYFWG